MDHDIIPVLPAFQEPKEMSNKFSTYFKEKIENVLKENKPPVTRHI